MKERIIDLGVTHGIATRYTAFLVVEERTGARRTHQQAETRVIPVHAPAGWTLARPRPDLTKTGGILCGGVSMLSAGMPAPGPMMPAAAAPMGRMRAESAKQEESVPSGDPVLELLARQLASGLWPGSDEPARVKAAAGALATLAAAGVRTTHTKYGAQVKKAIEALLEALPRLAADLATLALAAAWLVADGRRTRDELRRLAASHPGLAAVLDDDAQVRALATPGEVR